MRRSKEFLRDISTSGKDAARFVAGAVLSLAS
jgi:hypothetical protein